MSQLPEPLPDPEDGDEQDAREQELAADVIEHSEEVILRLLAMMRQPGRAIRALRLIERYAHTTVQFVAEVTGEMNTNIKSRGNTYGGGPESAITIAGMDFTPEEGGQMAVRPRRLPTDPRVLTGAMRDARALGDEGLEQVLRARLDEVLGVAPTPEADVKRAS